MPSQLLSRRHARAERGETVQLIHNTQVRYGQAIGTRVTEASVFVSGPATG
jgi:hypothetical protein